MSKAKSIATNSFIVSAITAVSTVLGLVRESSVAYMFGASGNTDAYLIAAVVPTILSGIVSGACTNTFITVYSSYLARGEEEQAWKSTNIIISFLALILGGFTLLLAFFAPEVLKFLSPTFDVERFYLSVSLTRVMLPTLLLGGLTGILTGINNSHNSFIAPASIGLVSNLLIISCIYTVGRAFGIYGLAIGATLGMLIQFCLQYFSARRQGFRYRFALDFRDQGFRQIMLLVVPFIFSSIAWQINLVVDRALASRLPPGSVSALYFSQKLVFIPQQLLSGVAMVVFPLIVKAAELGNWTEFFDGFTKGARLLLLFLVPGAIGLYVLRYPLVALMYQHGVFSPSDTYLTANTIPYLLGGLICGPLVTLLFNVYFALRRYTLATVISVIVVSLNIVFSLLLIGPMGQAGLALANSLSSLANLLLLFLLLFVMLPAARKVQFALPNLYSFCGKIAVSGLVMGYLVFIYYSWASSFIVGKLAQGVFALSAVAVGLLVYFGLTACFKVTEVYQGVNWLINKVKMRRMSNDWS